MARDFSRRIDSVVSRPPSSGGGVMQSLGRTLMARRDARKAAVAKPPPPKLALTTTKEKQQVIEEMMTNKLPSALSLLKLRQRAAKGEVLGQKARDFLNRSQAGKKLEGREALQKYAEEALQAELEATASDPHSPVHYKLRQGGTEHLRTKAKGILREVEHDRAVDTTPKPSAMDIRRERLSVLHGIHESLQTAPAPAPTPAVVRPTMPMFQTPMPLTMNAGTPRAGGMIFATGAPNSRPHGPTGLNATPASHASNAGRPEPSTAPADTTTPSPTFVEPTPLSAPAPVSESTPTTSAEPSVPTPTEPTSDVSSVDDAFGGSGEDE